MRLNYSNYLCWETLFQLVWLNPDDNHELMWDYGMCVDTSRGAAVRDLIAKALKGALAPTQQEVIIILLFFDIRLNSSKWREENIKRGKIPNPWAYHISTLKDMCLHQAIQTFNLFSNNLLNLWNMLIISCHTPTKST